jgi:NitT/TauT family transport system ATP-binding protein
LLRIIGDLVSPTTGIVRINGKSARQARLDLDYGIVFQDPVLFEPKLPRATNQQLFVT